MNNKLKKIVKFTPLIFFAAAVVSVLFANQIRNIPEGTTYIYNNGVITEHSWQDMLPIAANIMLLLVLIWLVALTIISAVYMIKAKEKLGITILLSWVTGIVCLVCMLLSAISIDGWDNDDYYPDCYEFTDGQHTIVIEEKSWLMDGRATIYQIHENSTATIIGGFSTDDGGRNCGNYEIEWYDTSAKITYRTFSTKTSKGARIVSFK